MDQDSVDSNFQENYNNPFEQMSSTVNSKSYKSRLMDIEFSLHGDFRGIGSFLSVMRDKVRNFLDGTRAGEMFDMYCGLVEESCILKFLLITLIVCCILPVSAFVVLCAVCLVAAFTGFVLMEGAIIILSACAAILWLGAMGLLLIMIATLTTFIYLIYKCAGDIAYKIETMYLTQNPETVDDDMVMVDHEHED